MSLAITQHIYLKKKNKKGFLVNKKEIKIAYLNLRLIVYINYP